MHTCWGHKKCKRILITSLWGTNNREFETFLKLAIEIWRRHKILVTFYLALDFFCLFVHSVCLFYYFFSTLLSFYSFSAYFHIRQFCLLLVSHIFLLPPPSSLFWSFSSILSCLSSLPPQSLSFPFILFFLPFIRFILFFSSSSFVSYPPSIFPLQSSSSSGFERLSMTRNKYYLDLSSFPFSR